MVKTFNNQITDRVFEIIKSRKFALPGHIRKEYRRIYFKEIQWITIKNHLELLCKKGFLTKKDMSLNGKKKFILYKIIED